MYDIKPMLPFVGGGVVPGLVPKFMNDAGNDVLLGVCRISGRFPPVWEEIQRNGQQMYSSGLEKNQSTDEK